MAEKTEESEQTSIKKPKQRLSEDRFASAEQGDSLQNVAPPSDLARKTAEFVSKNTAAARSNIEQFVAELSSPLSKLSVIETELQNVQDGFAKRLQDVLSGLVGWSGGSFEANQEVARRIQALLQQLQVRVKCPKTGLPGNLRHRKGGNAKFGTFQIEIVENGKRTSRSSSTTFPALELVKHGEQAENPAS